jgi:hypothetical protein
LVAFNLLQRPPSSKFPDERARPRQVFAEQSRIRQARCFAAI